jgi:hypothetical protein
VIHSTFLQLVLCGIVASSLSPFSSPMFLPNLPTQPLGLALPYPSLPLQPLLPLQLLPAPETKSSRLQPSFLLPSMSLTPSPPLQLQLPRPPRPRPLLLPSFLFVLFCNISHSRVTDVPLSGDKSRPCIRRPRRYSHYHWFTFSILGSQE